MIMKKLLHIVVAAIFVTTLLQSCLKEDNDYFSETATQRLENTLNMYDSLLTSSKNGWHIQQFTPTTKDLAGIAFYSVFKDGKATVRTEAYMQDVANYVDSTEGYYSVKGDNGPVLSFDTSNPYITWFADAMPGYPDASGGEFEFNLISVSQDKDTIYALGKRTLRSVYMYRIKKPLKEYMAEYETMYGIIGTKTLPQSLVTGKDTLTCIFYPSYRNIGIYYADKGSTTITEHLHGYGISPTNIRFYNDVTLPNGITFSSCDYDSVNNLFTTPAKDVTIEGMTPSKLMVSGAPIYFRGTSSYLGSDTYVEWAKAAKAIKASGYTLRNLYYLNLGTDLSTGNFGLFVNLGRSDPAFIRYDYKLVDSNHIAVRKSSETGSFTNGTDFYAKGLNYVSDMFAPINSWKTYKIVYDNPKSPYDITLTDVDNANNYYVLNIYAKSRPLGR
jgi:hypothetical protein